MNRNITTIAKREFLSYINSATAYLLIVPFVLISYFLFFRQAFITNQANMRPFFDLPPFILLFVAPAISMRTFAQEQRNKTLEVLFSHPITELEIILGKFFGSLLFYGLMLAVTLTIPLTIVLFSKPDLGVIVGQYLGALFLGAAFISVGIATATLVSSQVASFLLASAINFILILIGFDIVLLSLPSSVGAFVSQLAVIPHNSNISRGALDLRDLLYFVSLIGLALTVAVLKLSARTIAENEAAKQKLYLALGLITLVGVITNVLMYQYPIRLDLTHNRLFTLSRGTKTTLNSLPDIVTVTLYTSSNLPGTIENTVRQTKDLLRDYKRVAKGKINLVEKHPDTNPQDKTSAQTDGIEEVQFNTLSNNAFAVQAGYVGLTLQYLDKKESIPFIQNPSDLEYQMTRLIRKMTTNTLPSLSLFTQPDIAYNGQQSSINILRESLKDQYLIHDIDLTQSSASISGMAVMVYGLHTNMGSTASAKLRNFIQNGGNALILMDNHAVNPQSGYAPSYNVGIEDVLSSDFGISTNQDLVYDVRLNEVISLQAGRQTYVLPYPFWLKALPGKTTSMPVDSLGSVTLAWPNSFSFTNTNGIKQEAILVSSRNSGAQNSSFQISPDKMNPENFKADNQERTLAVLASKDSNKVVVVGDSDFITDQFVQNSPQNLSFINMLIDTVTADDVMATVTQKTGGNPVFTFNSASQVQTVQLVNILGVPAVTGLLGGWWLWRRKKLYRRKYS